MVSNAPSEAYISAVPLELLTKVWKMIILSALVVEGTYCQGRYTLDAMNPSIFVVNRESREIAFEVFHAVHLNGRGNCRSKTTYQKALAVEEMLVVKQIIDLGDASAVKKIIVVTCRKKPRTTIDSNKEAQRPILHL
jgi:hypothetical protein